MRKSRKKLLIIPIVVILLFSLYVSYMSFYFLILPNSRIYVIGNVRADAEISAMRKVSYVYIEVGNSANPLTKKPVELHLRSDEGRQWSLNDLTKQELDAAATGRSTYPPSWWPEGTSITYVNNWIFYVFGDDIVGFSVGPAYGSTQVSTDGVSWYSFPLTQEEIEKVCGAGGRIVDSTRF